MGFLAAFWPVKEGGSSGFLIIDRVILLILSLCLPVGCVLLKDPVKDPQEGLEDGRAKGQQEL